MLAVRVKEKSAESMESFSTDESASTSTVINVPISFWKLIFVSLCLVIGVTALYFPVRNFSFFNFDDNDYITENPFVFGGLSRENIYWAFTKTHSGHWHPLTWLSHMLDVELFGLDAGAFHFENALFHSLNTALLFCFIVRLTGGVGLSLFVAAVFGFHPMRLESVAWIAERKDVLSLCFGLLTLLAYQSYSARRTLLRYSLVICLFVLGLLAKPMLVTLPILFLLLDWYSNQAVSKRIGWKLFLEKIPLLVLSAGSSLAVILGQSESGGLKSLSITPLAERVANSSVGYLGYLGKLFWPTGFGIFYPLVSYPPGVAAGAIISLLTISSLVFRERQRRPYLIFGWLWFLVALLPVIGIVQVGGQAMADRWTYLPHIGLILAVGLFAREQFAKRELQKTMPLFALAPVIIFAVITRTQLYNWKDTQSIFRHTLEVSPNNFMAHTNLGVELDRTNNLESAALHYEEAARINPFYPEALNNLGILRARQNRIPEAIELLEKNLAIRPEDFNARYNLGLALSQRGDNLAAAAELMRVFVLRPDYRAAFDSLNIVISRLSSMSCEQVRSDSSSEQRFRREFQNWPDKQSGAIFRERMEIVMKCLE